MREVIYKGATRPPMKWRVPLTALLAAFMPAVLILVWATVIAVYRIGRGGLLVAAFGFVLVMLAYVWMRWTTARDDQRLMQMFKSLKLRMLNHNRELFGNRSYGAYRARGARDAWRKTDCCAARPAQPRGRLASLQNRAP